MTRPTQREIIEHVREHFGISAIDVLSIMKTPTHPKELRDEFAAKAMQVDYKLTKNYSEPYWRIGVSLDAYKMADAMLKARSME